MMQQRSNPVTHPANLFHQPGHPASMPTSLNPAGQPDRPQGGSEPERITPAQLVELVKEKPLSRITFRITIKSPVKGD